MDNVYFQPTNPGVYKYGRRRFPERQALRVRGERHRDRDARLLALRRPKVSRVVEAGGRRVGGGRALLVRAGLCDPAAQHHRTSEYSRQTDPERKARLAHAYEEFKGEDISNSRRMIPDD
jgi:hypothetical protein